MARNKHTALDALYRYAEFLGYGEIHTRFDHQTGLQAIIAVHSLRRGPAIGGCRLLPYPSIDAALEDVLRLGHMMSYKAAVSQLNHGGAKAVLIRPPRLIDREAYFRAFAECVHELGGRYITAVDSGTSISDMDIIAKYTPYVTCTTHSGIQDDPSPYTAMGVRRGIEAGMRFRLGRESLKGTHVAIQGAGHVGYCLAKELTELGARVTMCDVNKTALERCVSEMGVATVPPDKIFDVEADVFAPCALGAVLNADTIARLRVKVVAGSANNQLAHQRHAAVLQERGILYAPDFVINAGGLIYVAAIYDHADVERAKAEVRCIDDTLTDIFVRARSENTDCHTAAFQLAQERLQ